MEFPQFIIAMTLLSIPVISIIGHYVMKLRQIQIANDGDLIAELQAVNRKLDQLQKKVDALEGGKSAKSAGEIPRSAAARTSPLDDLDAEPLASGTAIKNALREH